MRLNHLKALKEGKTMNDKMPIITLLSGLRVGNFSSPHEFRFVTGEILPACSPERARALMLEVEEREVANARGFTDIRIEFHMSNAVKQELDELLVHYEWFDVVLVPLPVQQAIRACDEAVGVNWRDNDKWHRMLRYTRVCRVADRVTKTIHGDRFCL
jgi:hypothetical protein